MSLSLLFYGLDRFSLHPYSISRQFWVREIQAVCECQPFFLFVWRWRNSLRGRTAMYSQTSTFISTLAIQEDIYEGLFVRKDVCTALQQFLTWLWPAEVMSQWINYIYRRLKSGWQLASNEASKHSDLFETKLRMLKLTFIPTRFTTFYSFLHVCLQLKTTCGTMAHGTTMVQIHKKQKNGNQKIIACRCTTNRAMATARIHCLFPGKRSVSMPLMPFVQSAFQLITYLPHIATFHSIIIIPYPFVHFMTFTN